VDSGLFDGDVIHSMNRVQITSVDNLRAEFGKLKPGEPAAMQVERNGKLRRLRWNDSRRVSGDFASGADRYCR
jgi:S1-C subfamily serine protease